MKIGNILAAAALALAVSCAGFAGEMDIQEMQAWIAARRAEVKDLRAKAAQQYDRETADGIVSMRKNAVVTVGGTVNTRYTFRRGTLKSRLELGRDPVAYPIYRDTGDMRKREGFKAGDLSVYDAKMDMKIDVSEHFDAYLKLDFHDAEARANVSGIAENYWIRWKNICGSGFGVLAGRDALKYGDDQPIGVLDSWNKDAFGSFADVFEGSGYRDWDFTMGNGMFAYGSMLPAHTTYKGLPQNNCFNYLLFLGSIV